MPHPVFAAHLKHLESLKAERLLDAAQAASVPHMGEAASGWFDRTVAMARGASTEVKEKVRVLFSWNGAPVNSSAGLRQKFSQDVAGSRVET